jgi:flagellar protein FliL
MAERDDEKDDNQPEPTKLDVAKLGFLLLAAMNVMALFVGGMLVYKSTVAYEPPGIREEKVYEQFKVERESTENAEPLMYTMEPFTVNLNGAPRRVIRVQMTLEMLDKDGFEEVVTLGPQARDAVVRILNNKEFKDVETIQGKLFLKDQIAVTLNEFLDDGVVKDVYFSGFLVQ